MLNYQRVNLHEKLLGFLSGLRPAMACPLFHLDLGPPKKTTFPTHRFPNGFGFPVGNP
jgi:hypothetical protein